MRLWRLSGPLTKPLYLGVGGGREHSRGLPPADRWGRSIPYWSSLLTLSATPRKLLVIARNSTFAFKDRPTDIRVVGAKLGARYVVEGSTRRAGDQLVGDVDLRRDAGRCRVVEDVVGAQGHGGLL